MKGNRIRILREEKKLTQSELAKILSISSSAIAMYERDEREPNDDLTLKLAEYFDVSTDFLLGNSDIRNPKIANSILNTDGLELEDLNELQKQIDYIKRIKNK